MDIETFKKAFFPRYFLVEEDNNSDYEQGNEKRLQQNLSDAKGDEQAIMMKL